jgi:hypothetical protein
MSRHVAAIGGMRNMYKAPREKPKGKGPVKIQGLDVRKVLKWVLKM